MFDNNLTNEQIKEIHDAAVSASDSDEAWNILAPLMAVQTSNTVAVNALIHVIGRTPLTIEKSLDLLSEVFDAHQSDDDIVILMSNKMNAGREGKLFA